MSDPGSEQRAIAPSEAIGNASLGYGSGGPAWLDDFRSERAPAPSELVNAYKATAFACVRLNATGVARVPLRLYAKTGAGQKPPGRGLRDISRSVPGHRERYLRALAGVQSIVSGGDEIAEVVEHPFLDAMARPNTYFDGSLFLTYLATSLDVVGSAYFVPVTPSPQIAAREFWPLQAQYVQPIKGTGQNGQILSHYNFMGKPLAPDEVVRARFISLRDPYLSGYAPLQACFEQVGISNFYGSTVKNILRNGARPSGALVPRDSQLRPGLAESRRTEYEINNRFNQQRAGYVMVLDGTYDWLKLDYSPTDLGGLELTKFQRLQIANCFDVPISLLQTEDSNRAVAEAGNYQHQRNGIAPRCVALASALTSMAQAVDPRLFWAFDNPVEADGERQARIMDMQIKAGVRTVNEARREDGLPDVEGGDEPILSGVFMRLVDVGKPPEPTGMFGQPFPPMDTDGPDTEDEADTEEDADAKEAGNEPAEEAKPTEDPEADDDAEATRTALRILKSIEDRLNAQQSIPESREWVGDLIQTTIEEDEDPGLVDIDTIDNDGVNAGEVKPAGDGIDTGQPESVGLIPGNDDSVPTDDATGEDHVEDVQH